MSRPIIYILDDDDAMRQALTDLLSGAGYQPIAFARPTEFLEQFDPSQHGCLVLDVCMPEMSGLEIQRRLNRMGSMLPVILITGHGEVPIAVQAIKNGALDFLEKPFRHQVLLERIDTALQRDMENRELVERHSELRRRWQSLTSREQKVMALIVAGYDDKVIATDLGISEQMAETHRSNVLEKMAATSIAHLVRMQLILSGESDQAE